MSLFQSKMSPRDSESLLPEINDSLAIIKCKCALTKQNEFHHSAHMTFPFDPGRQCGFTKRPKSSNRIRSIRFQSGTMGIYFEPSPRSNDFHAYMTCKRTRLLVPHHIHLTINLTCTQRTYRGLWRPHEHCEST